MERPIRVVLIDDHALVRAGMREFLVRADGIDVVGEADDSKGAMALIASVLPDVALVDIKMPGTSGIELTQWVRANHPRTQVLVVSAYDDDAYVTAAIDAGAAGYVLKNTSPGRLTEAVRLADNGQASLDPAVASKVMRLAGSRVERAAAELSSRELDVLGLVATGMTNKDIAGELFISARTVQGHLRRVFEKLGVETRTEAVTVALARGLISLDVPS